jgi:hypothetical protein
MRVRHGTYHCAGDHLRHCFHRPRGLLGSTAGGSGPPLSPNRHEPACPAGRPARWANATPSERQAHAELMNVGRAIKRLAGKEEAA